MEKGFPDLEARRDFAVSETADLRYRSIDWLTEEIKETNCISFNEDTSSIPHSLRHIIKELSPWILAALSGTLTAIITALTDVTVEFLADFKEGRCTHQWWKSRHYCKESSWQSWSNRVLTSYLIYILIAITFAFFSVIITLQSKRSLYPNPRSSASNDASTQEYKYMAAGSGIAEIKSILSGFELPHLLDESVTFFKIGGMVFAISAGLCLGKEAPMIHIATGIGFCMARLFPACTENGVRLRENLTVSSAAGLSAAFGTPIGGVLFCYEEVSTFFTRPVMLRAVLCSLLASTVLKALNPLGIGSLVQYATRFSDLSTSDYLAFLLLGFAGGVFGAAFCRLYRGWSLFKKKYTFLLKIPIIEVLVATLITAIIQFPNIIIRGTGVHVFRDLLTTCDDSNKDSFICLSELASSTPDRQRHLASLGIGVVSKLFLTVITFGAKIPTGILIPALDTGALFGRLVGNLFAPTNPGVYAAVAAGAFLAGTTRMVLSLAVIMVELTGASEMALGYLLAILTAKTVADILCPDGIYEIGLELSGHPFLEPNTAATLDFMDTSQAVDLLQVKEDGWETTIIADEAEIIDASKLLAVIEKAQLGQLADVVLLSARHELLGFIPSSKLSELIAMIHANPAQIRCCVGMNNQLATRVPETLDIRGFVNRPTVIVESSTSLVVIMKIFVQLGLNSVPLVEGMSRKFVGLVTKGDVVRFVANRKALD